MRYKLILFMSFIGLTACNGLPSGDMTAASSAVATAGSAVVQPAAGGIKTNLNVKNQMSHAKADSIQDDKSACHSLRVACRSAGFTLVDAVVGNRLISDCLQILVKGQAATNKVTGQIAQVPANSDLPGCASRIHSGPKPTTGIRSASIPAVSN